MVNGTRFITEKLNDIEGKILGATNKIKIIESEIFNELSKKIIDKAVELKKVADILAYLDVTSSLAELAHKNNYHRPIIDDSKKFEIINGRHPIVEPFTQKNAGEQFIANDCKLESNQKLWLITGPNMAGKSTFLRQNAIIAIMAQVGSFVPAERAHIGIIDRVFSRVGAGDDLAQGRSTFLVEMIETATILNQATDKSLVILDEIGRGTSTYDGLAIAWGCLEYIHNQLKCRTLFATHYHELTELSNKLKSLKCYTAKVKEWEGKVIFMHKVTPGIADRSYGINVAELAGIPKIVINRAKEVLHELHDQNHIKKKADPLIADLFTYSYQQNNKSQLEELLGRINPNEISPKEALDFLYKLKKITQN
jgi:DNA mismatch repair protein MutS